MELEGGLTPVDTLYEWSGLVLSERFAETLLWSWGLLGILMGAALLRLLYQAYLRGAYVELTAYPVYLSFMLFLISPVSVSMRPRSVVFSKLWADPSTLSVQWNGSRDEAAVGAQDLSVRVPRIVGLSHRIMESCVRRMMTDVRENSSFTLFRWQAVVAAREQAAILDPALRTRYHRFLAACYWPARALGDGPEAAPGSKSITGDELPLVGSAVRYPEALEIHADGVDASCHEENQKLLEGLYAHVAANEVHRNALQATLDEVRKSSAGAADGAQLSSQYLARILYNETFSKLGESDVSRLREALPEYHALDQRFFATAGRWTVGQGISGMLSFFGGLAEASSQETLGPTLYYRVTLYAPYLFGLLQAVWLMGFPIAALWSLWPGCYKVLVHYITSWASLKIWPVFWSWLSHFNVGRLSLPAEDPLGLSGTGGSASMFTSIAAMYVLVPALSLLLFNLAARSGMAGISNFVGSGTGSGPALGMMASAGSAAGRGVSLARNSLGS
ncbi:MAG: conjugal transfer protein TraG N-terminal domain-containing protein [Planctomycetaceae bacterium]|nr:conjugal transfer protein TraG N-terminal domain-containing protein [Planctomycetaceae bacterium]